MEQPKNIFAFVHYGPPLNPDVVSAYPLNVKKIKSTKHSDDLNYTIIHTSQPKRSAQVLNVITKYNATCSVKGERLVLSCLPSEPVVISFSRGVKPSEHVIGQVINHAKKLLQCGKYSTYWGWGVNAQSEQVGHGCGVSLSMNRIQHIHDVDILFDVVKKRKTIVAANESVGADVTSVLLGSEAAAEYFHQFSSEVSSMIVCVFSNLNILMCRLWMLLRP